MIINSSSNINKLCQNETKRFAKSPAFSKEKGDFSAKNICIPKLKNLEFT